MHYGPLDAEMLEILIRMLDDRRNDIFIMLDAKSDESKFKNVRCYYSNLFFCDNRIKVYWGHVSQIENELNLFEFAINQDNYQYFHLISGSDLPIKTQDYIHAFFSRNAGLEFITIKQGQTVDSIMREKLDTWQLFDKKMRHHNRIVRGVSNRMRACINRLQHIIGVHRQYSFTKL